MNGGDIMADIDNRAKPKSDNEDTLAKMEKAEEKLSSVMGFMMSLDNKLDDIRSTLLVILIIAGALLGSLMVLIAR